MFFNKKLLYSLDLSESYIILKSRGKIITNPDWLKPKEKPYFHQISLDCIKKLVECMESFDIDDMDCDTCLKIQKILRVEIDDTEFLEFAIENLSELLSYIESGRVNIRIHKDITGKMWIGV